MTPVGAKGFREAIFTLGEPDGSAMEFGIPDQGWQGFSKQYPKPVVFHVGKDPLSAWPYIHPASHDGWAGGTNHTFTLLFDLKEAPKTPLYLIVGQLEAHASRPLLNVSVNGSQAGSRRVEPGSGGGSGMPEGPGRPASMVFPLPEGALRAGENAVELTLTDGSWMIYDYVRLSPQPQPPKIGVLSSNLMERMLTGPMKGVESIVFVQRKIISEHWYANFSYYASDTGPSYFQNSNKLYRDGARLCRLDLKSGRMTVLLDDPSGGIRDPQISYDGKKILFAYRKGGTPNFLLHEIDADGSALRQLTQGAYDDFEPTYLPNGDIMFVSSRCQRWVNCWLTQVAVLHRCDAQGQHVRPISSNNEQDNTPWPLPDGRILFTRWEYVDRSQVDYHHLWVVNPDGTSQMIYYGNMHPSTLMIDAKTIPDSTKIVACFSPGHGQTEHEGAVAVVDVASGPDDTRFAKTISRGQNFRDPWAFSEDCFMAAQGAAIVLMNERGTSQDLFRLPEADIQADFQVHEPRPILARARETIIPDRTSSDRTTGQLVLADIYEGRNMAGIRRGEIKKMLVLETLPKPINFTGGMEPMSYGGTFTMERIVGTVPVEEDGSAYFDLPALRSFFFVALDKNNLAVKRMQSFVTVQPGEVTGCVGCHEQRTKAVPASFKPSLASRRAPSRIEPVADSPEVLDFPRDIQPILDRHCVRCHDTDKPNHGGVFLSGDRGPMFSIAYFNLTARDQLADGRNLAKSNYSPRTLGSGGSRLMDKIDGSHYGTKISDREQTLVRLWLDVGSPYPGTYAALGSGMVGGYAQNTLDHPDAAWPATKASAPAFKRRCTTCHTGARTLPMTVTDNMGRHPWEYMAPDDPRRRYSRHRLYNLTHPERSLILLAPLFRKAGGLELCRTTDGKPGSLSAATFESDSDPDFALILAAIADAGKYLQTIKRFDMPGFQPRPEWLREMKRYGILPENTTVADPYDTERRYWESLWHRPSDW
jgi:hypothetical protein